MWILKSKCEKMVWKNKLQQPHTENTNTPHTIHKHTNSDIGHVKSNGQECADRGEIEVGFFVIKYSSKMKKKSVVCVLSFSFWLLYFYHLVLLSLHQNLHYVPRNEWNKST